MISWKRCFVLLLVSLCTMTCAVAQQEQVPTHSSSLLDQAHDKFDALDDKGKFVVGTAVGFLGTRILLGSAMTAIKMGAIAFITAEVLHHTGVLDVQDTLEDIVESDAVQKLKKHCTAALGGFRAQVRRRLNPLNAKDLLEQQRSATLGAASGAVVACLL